jgi:AcrR family transcriptional regulator
VRPVAADGRATPTRDDEVRKAVVAIMADALRARPYDHVTYTFVARLARVTTADVRRCFPTKAEMVLTALRRLPGRPAGRATLELSGAEIVTRHLEFWETGDNAVILRSLYTASADDRRLAAAIEAHTIATLIAPFAARVKTTDACPRARLAVAELLGLAVSRYVLHQEPLASADHETIAAWAGPALDYFLKGELGRTA